MLKYGKVFILMQSKYMRIYEFVMYNTVFYKRKMKL